MKNLGMYFFSVDIRIRAAVLLALVIVFFWWILGKGIIWAASFFPYLIRIIFKGVYLIIEIPICWIHSKAGSPFHGIDNGLANIGNNIDTFLKQWYMRWHNPKSNHIFLSVIIYCVLIIWICIPYHPDTMNGKYISGQYVYLTIEKKFTQWMEKYGWHEKQVEEIMNYNEKEWAEEEDIEKEIVMKVNTQKDPLSIRDVPSIENCQILERVERGDTVVWKGDMAFGNGSNRGVEPWIKVETLSGTIGWARLIYLCPIEEEDFELKLHID